MGRREKAIAGAHGKESTLGVRLREARHRKGLSQADVERAAGGKIPRGYLSRLEHGLIARPGDDIVSFLADHLDLDIGELQPALETFQGGLSSIASMLAQIQTRLPEEIEQRLSRRLELMLGEVLGHTATESKPGAHAAPWIGTTIGQPIVGADSGSSGAVASVASKADGADVVARLQRDVHEVLEKTDQTAAVEETAPAQCQISILAPRSVACSVKNVVEKVTALLERSDFDAARELALRKLRNLENHAGKDRGQIYSLLARIATRSAAPREVIMWAEEGLFDLARCNYFGIETVDLIHQLGIAWGVLGQGTRQLMCDNHAIMLRELVEIPKAQPTMANLLRSRGLTYWTIGDWLAAERDLHRSLELAEAAGDEMQVALTKGSYCLLLLRRGLLDEAERLCKESFQIREKLGASVRDMAFANRYLAEIFLAAESSPSSDLLKNQITKLMKRALRFYWTSNDKKFSALSAITLSKIRQRQRRFHQAKRWARFALNIACAAGLPAEQARARTQLGAILTDEGEFVDAEAHLREGARLFFHKCGPYPYDVALNELAQGILAMRLAREDPTYIQLAYQRISVANDTFSDLGAEIERLQSAFLLRQWQEMHRRWLLTSTDRVVPDTKGSQRSNSASGRWDADAQRLVAVS